MRLTGRAYPFLVFDRKTIFKGASELRALLRAERLRERNEVSENETDY